MPGATGLFLYYDLIRAAPLQAVVTDEPHVLLFGPASRRRGLRSVCRYKYCARQKDHPEKNQRSHDDACPAAVQQLRLLQFML